MDIYTSEFYFMTTTTTTKEIIFEATDLSEL